MGNAVIHGRMQRLFDAYDPDHDDYMTLANFTDHVYKLAAMRGHAVDSPEVRGLLESLRGWWDASSRDADLDRDGRVSRAEFVAWAENLAVGLKQALDAGGPWPLDGWIEVLYQVIDGNRDGVITLQEYRDWCTALGIASKMDVDAAFRGFDKNKDGLLSRDEFAEVSRQFWTNDDPTTPGHRWVGP